MPAGCLTSALKVRASQICSVLGFKLESQALEIEAVRLCISVCGAVKKTLNPPVTRFKAIACVTADVLSNNHPNGVDPLQM
jgi:hypothetical protein